MGYCDFGREKMGKWHGGRKKGTAAWEKQEITRFGLLVSRWGKRVQRSFLGLRVKRGGGQFWGKKERGILLGRTSK